ncbi:hypothetical protein SH1V18_36850 [Vallitalea longa]|uniref:HTH tetR-type domain-containing protein n=1 Tax=Vallitalea longa TaxID=2936439 RepID=A0A9W5YEU2_9FIRM|nr:TetR/AcrR family transcriptional regulator [Vallitalea longa]GKX31205.1 hypothetical protein SH1V18_36850 [Vallitalea longa]
MPQVLKDDIKNRIINVAIDMFKNNGYAKTSMKNIAKEAKVAVGNLYRYFNSKEDLYNEIIKEFVDTVNNIIKENTHDMVNLEDMEEDVYNIVNKLEDYPNYLGVYPMVSKICYELSEYISDNKDSAIIFFQSSKEVPSSRLNLTEIIQKVLYGKMKRDMNKTALEDEDKLYACSLAKGFYETLSYIVINMEESFNMADLMNKVVKLYFL